jgi:hypothetical protein
MKPVLYTILFTRPGQEVSRNEYLWIYLTWLWSIIHHNVLASNEELYVFIDEPSFSFLKKQYAFGYLHSLIKFKINYIQINQPPSLNAGVFERYNPSSVDIMISNYSNLSETVFMYCDIDNMLLKPINTLSWSSSTNTVYPTYDGPVLSTNYYGGYIPSPDETDIYNTIKSQLTNSVAGFTCGLFAYSFDSKEKILNFLNNIYKYRNHDKVIYFEQASFNFVVFVYLFKNMLTLSHNAFNTPGILAINNFLAQNNSILSLMGMAGDESFHMDKCMGFLFHQLELSKRTCCRT